MNIITLFCEIDDFFLAYEKTDFAKPGQGLRKNTLDPRS